MDELDHRLALARAPGGGRGLLERYGSARAAFESGPADPALSSELQRFLREPDRSAVAADRAWLEADPNRHALLRGHPGYPAQLEDLADPPPLLFVVGEPAALGPPQLAVVGSRNPSRGGRDTARDFARHLAGAGLTLTSGLAVGIDGAAHEGALAGGGTTVAVLGTGPDRVYPARHRELAHAIVDGGGALVSEFPPGAPPLRHHFPRRNRIISGLAAGVLVVEAAVRSGSLITARLAGEQGREVFAIPGSIHNPLARGCHRLLREGAKLVEEAADILEELAPQLRAALFQDEEETSKKQEDSGLDDEYYRLLECLGHDPVAVDEVVERSGLTADVVSSMLLLLELHGHVASAPGNRYQRTRGGTT